MKVANGNNASHDPPGTARPAFWTTLPGVLTGLATLLTAIGGLVVVLNGMGGKAGPVSGTKTSTISTEGTATSAVPSSLDTPSSSGADGILAQGTLSMKSPDGANLEKGTVGSVTPSDIYLYCVGLSCSLNPVGSGLMTVPDGSVGKAACAAALKARNDGAVDLAKLVVGSILCTQSGGGHVARLQVTGLAGVGSEKLTFAYAVWR